MLGFVSHELKSPVASMVTDAQLLSQGYLGDLTPSSAPRSSGMARKGQYLLDLVREYLDLARVEGGELRLDAALARGRQRGRRSRRPSTSCARRSTAHGMQPHDRLAARRPFPRSVATRRCCASCSVNLLDNAIKYGNEGGEHPPHGGGPRPARQPGER